MTTKSQANLPQKQETVSLKEIFTGRRMLAILSKMVIPEENSKIIFSIKKCLDFGNQLFLPGYEIVEDQLSSEYGGGGFQVESPEACQTECFARYASKLLNISLSFLSIVMQDGPLWSLDFPE